MFIGHQYNAFRYELKVIFEREQIDTPCTWYIPHVIIQNKNGTSSLFDVHRKRVCVRIENET